MLVYYLYIAYFSCIKYVYMYMHIIHIHEHVLINAWIWMRMQKEFKAGISYVCREMWNEHTYVSLCLYKCAYLSVWGQVSRVRENLKEMWNQKRDFSWRKRSITEPEGRIWGHVKDQSQWNSDWCALTHSSTCEVGGKAEGLLGLESNEPGPGQKTIFMDLKSKEKSFHLRVVSETRSARVKGQEGTNLGESHWQLRG